MIMKRSKSINDLTSDDSKILGNWTKRKSEKLSNKNQFSTSQFRTIYSNWSPISNKSYNRTLFQERNDLILNWFDIWSDQQRNEFLIKLLLRCGTDQLSCIYDYFNQMVPLKKVDFTRILPKFLSLKIFSYLDPRSLSRSSQVSWHWKFLTEQDVLWIPKCIYLGWYLPFSPSNSEYGCWKRHYVSNALSSNMSIDNKRGAVWKQLAFTSSLSNVNEKRAKSPSFYDTQNKILNSAITKPQWAISAAFPVDLEKGSKALFAGFDPNKPIIHHKAMEYMNSIKSSPRNKSTTYNLTPRNTKDKISLNQLLNLEERMIMKFNEYEKTPLNVKGFNIVKCNETEFLSGQKSIITSVALQNTNPRVIFISSKLPAAEMLLDSVLFGVISIPYDYESSTLATLIYDLRMALRGRKAKSIGLFGHRNKENELWIVRSKCLSLKMNIKESTEIQEFLNNLAVSVISKLEGGHVDLFSPFGALEAGKNFLGKINELTNSTFISPSSAIGEYSFVLGNWTHYPENNSHPCLAYFTPNRLHFWLEFNDTISEIVIDAKRYLRNQYPEIEEVISKKLTGSIVREAVLFNSNIDIQKVTQDLLKPLLKCGENNPLATIKEHLSKTLSETEREKGSFQDRSSTIVEKKNQTKSEYWSRKSIVKHLLLHMKRYLQTLKSLHDLYFVPLKQSLNSNRPVLSAHNIQIIFGDILMFINPLEKLVIDLETRLQQWSTEQCVGDVLEIYSNDLIPIFGSFFLSYSNSLNTIERCRETNVKFRNFLNMRDNRPESGMLSLVELFLKPSQKVKETMTTTHWILANTPLEHVDIKNLKETLVHLSKISKIIVQEKSRINRAIKFKDIQELITNCPILLEKGRFFVTQENISLYMSPSTSKFLGQDLKSYVQSEDCGIFVFNDSIIITRITRELVPYFRKVTYNHCFEQALPLTQISLYDIPDMKDIKFAFQLQCGHKMWIFGCNSVEKKFRLTSILKQYINCVVNDD